MTGLMSGLPDLLGLTLFVLAAFAGGIATGLAGFAFGLVVSGIWLHVLEPVQVATLIVGYGLFVQAYGIWVVRRAFNWGHVIPLVIGSVIGAPIGVWLLHFLNPANLRLGVGALLIAYSLNGLLRPQVKGIPANPPVELGIGLLNGVLGGMTGLAGVFVTVWCGLRGGSKDEQRSVYQPVILGTFIVSAVALLSRGALTAPTLTLGLIGVVPLIAGVIVGFRLYHRLDDLTFRKIIMVLLLLSGLVLLVPELLALR
jgi:uncharacterized membrane protein YfcA